MIKSLRMIDTGKGDKVRADSMTDHDMIRWLEGSVPSGFKLSYYSERWPNTWRCRWWAFPCITSAGAGKTFSESLRRCFMCAVERHAAFPWFKPEDWEDTP